MVCFIILQVLICQLHLWRFLSLSLSFSLSLLVVNTFSYSLFIQVFMGHYLWDLLQGRVYYYTTSDWWLSEVLAIGRHCHRWCWNLFYILQLLPQPDLFPHYHAYIVKKTLFRKTCICPQEDWHDYHSYYFHHSFDPELRNLHFVVLLCLWFKYI